MLRSILNRAMGSRGRGRATGTTAAPRRKPAAGGGSANSEIAHGAKSVIKGAARKKRGL